MAKIFMREEYLNKIRGFYESDIIKVVTGIRRSGKSFFSRRLGEVLKIEVHHLDNLFWKSDRTHISRDEFDERLALLLKERS